MSDPIAPQNARTLEPVHAGEDEQAIRWTRYLVIFLRVMAGLSMLKGLFHWAQITGIEAPSGGGFIFQTTAWQVATIYFAVIDLVAAVGLWLAAAWGPVVWLTAIVSMAVVETLFPHIYGGRFFIVLIQLVLLVSYLFLAVMAARERPP